MAPGSPVSTAVGVRVLFSRLRLTVVVLPARSVNEEVKVKLPSEKRERSTVAVQVFDRQSTVASIVSS